MKRLLSINPGWWLTIATASFLFLPGLFREGMFIDGIFYAILSRNLAAGQGGFWTLFFSETYEPIFYAHPPLMMALESLFFRVLGEAYWVENLFGLSLFIASALVIVQIWKLVFPQWRSSAWLPLLAWMIVPQVFWSFGNNMLENMLSLWTLLACWAVLKAQLQPAWWLRGGMLAGIFCLLALHTKGPVGLFPLAIPLWWALSQRRKWQQAILTTGLIFILFLLTAFVLSYWQEAARFWEGYFTKQVVRSLNGQLATEQSRFFLLRRTLEELLPSLGLCTLLGLLNWRSWRAQSIPWRRVIFFLGIGLSASLPLLLSPKQRDFYLVPAFPYFAVGMSALVLDAWQRGRERWTRFENPVRWVGMAMLLGAIIFSVPPWGTPKRDQQTLMQAHEIGKIVPRREIVHICRAMERRFSLRWYLNRYYQQSQDHRMRDEYEYFLVQAPCPEFPEGEFTLVWSDGPIQLWQRKPNAPESPSPPAAMPN
ncbi:MAG: glycosyltransferase family 39 protein [Bacteroidota bacterium]